MGLIRAPQTRPTAAQSNAQSALLPLYAEFHLAARPSSRFHHFSPHIPGKKSTPDLQILITTHTSPAIKAALVMLYWKVGQRIRVDVLNEKRADDGEQIVSTLSAELVPDFGSAFAPENHPMRGQF